MGPLTTLSIELGPRIRRGVLVEGHGSSAVAQVEGLDLMSLATSTARSLLLIIALMVLVICWMPLFIVPIVGVSLSARSWMVPGTGSVARVTLPILSSSLSFAKGTV